MFPGLAAKIFDTLDDENLVNSKTVSRSWSEFTENEMFYQRRIIKKLIRGQEDFKDTWKLVMKKADIEMTKELASAVKYLMYFLSKHPGDDHTWRTQPFSPLHIGAEAAASNGELSLCEFILKVTKDKNPKLKTFDIGWTPLHGAAQNGHLLICYMIMSEITDKNPGDINGRTPLHVAAAMGHLETYKLIMNKVTDINPRDNGGWTPLHSAARRGHKELCKFIADRIEEKNPEDDYGSNPKNLLWNNVCGMFDQN